MNLLGVTLQIKKITLAKIHTKKLIYALQWKGVTHAYLLHECICSISHFGIQSLHPLSLNMKPFKNYIYVCANSWLLLVVKVKTYTKFY